MSSSASATAGSGESQRGATNQPVFARGGPWLFDRRTDLLAFGGSAALAFALLGVGSALGILEADAPDWIWIGCILGVDVAHVWSTLYRVYFDGAEVRRRSWLYLGAPVLCYGTGVFLHAMSAALFWTALAYLAVFHFVRQQVGWVRLYARREDSGPWDRRLDVAATYAATAYPILWWHGHLPRRFHWFVEGDFLSAHAEPLATALEPLYWAVLILWTLRQVQRCRSTPPSPGKLIVVTTTWVCWYLGIIALDGDYAFTVTNVLIHGLPYLVLTYRYGRARQQAPLLRRLLRTGPPLFLASVLLLALAEEAAWDRWVWHDRPSLFGQGRTLGTTALALLVPLLALPQSLHYVLDAFIWRLRGNPQLR